MMVVEGTLAVLGEEGVLARRSSVALAAVVDTEVVEPCTWASEEDSKPE